MPQPFDPVAHAQSASRQRGSQTAPPPEPLSRLISELSDLWRSHHGERLQPRDQEQESEPGGLEALRSFADEKNLDIILETRSIGSLTADDLPVVMVTQEGAGRILLERHGSDFILCTSNGMPYLMSKGLLEEQATGTVFLVRSQGLKQSMPSEAAPDATPERDPSRQVLNYMITSHRKLVIQLLVAAAFSNIMLLALPIYSGLIFDRVIPHSAFDTLWAITIGVVLALVADLAVRWVRLKLQDALASSASAELQAAVVRRMVRIKIEAAPRNSGAVSLRLRSIDGLAQLVPQFLTGVVIDAPFIVLVFALLWLNGGPVIAAPILGIAALVGLHHWTNSGVKADHARSMTLTQMQTNQLVEAVDNLEVIKSTRTEAKTLTQFERVFDEFAYSSHIVRLWHGLAAYANVTVGQLMVVLVLMIGAYEISAGNMTVGGLSTCSLLVGRIIWPIGQLVTVIHRMAQSRATLKSLFLETHGQTEAASDTSRALGTPSSGAFRLQNVCFSYSGQTATQIDNVSIVIRPGERVAFIGRSGSGKSTLMRLMMRFAEANRGSILVDEFDIRQYRPSDLRRALGYLNQSCGLLDDTLLANLTLGQEAVDAERLNLVTRMTGVADFAAKHAHGFGMKIGPRGERLSGGERQSVALARTLLGNPKVLLLDEPTAAMDTMLEARVVRDLKSLIGSATLVVATHRGPVLELVERIVWLDNGRVVADGPKADVLKRMSGAAA